MVSLIDTNIVVRFLVNDNDEQFLQSRNIITKIEKGTLSAVLLSEVVMEVLFVMTKYYGATLADVVEDLKLLLSLPGMVNRDKRILITALETMVRHRIDYVDALICAKTQLQSYEWISFDADLTKHC